MGIKIEVRRPTIPAGFTVIQKDILGHLGHFFSSYACREKNNIYMHKEYKLTVPAVPDPDIKTPVPNVPDCEEGEPFPFEDDDF